MASRLRCMLPVIVASASACAVVPDPAPSPSPAANPFDALIRYVPVDEIESLLLIDHARVPTLFYHAYGDPIRSVWAGGQFHFLPFGWHGVIVEQFAPCVPADWRNEHDGATRLVIRGVDALHVPCRSKENCVDSWFASPAPDVLLRATSPELLERALAGSGVTATVAAARLGWSSDIDQDAPLLIVRRFDPTNIDDITSPFKQDLHGCGISGLCGTMTASGGPLTIRVRTADPENTQLWLVGLLWIEPMQERFAHGVLTVVFPFDPESDTLSLFYLFGLNIFI